MRKIISFMHISLDGFVAGPNGEKNWIKVNEEISVLTGSCPIASTCPAYRRHATGRFTYRR